MVTEEKNTDGARHFADQPLVYVATAWDKDKDRFAEIDVYANKEMAKKRYERFCTVYGKSACTLASRVVYGSELDPEYVALQKQQGLEEKKQTPPRD